MAAAQARARSEGAYACAIWCRRMEFPHKIGSGIVWDKSGFRGRPDAACDRSTTRRCAPSKPKRAPPEDCSVSGSRATPSSPASARASRSRPACRSTPAPRRRPSASIRPAPSRQLRHRVARPGPGDDAGAGDRRASRLPRRGRADAAGRQRRGAGVRAPMRAAAPFWPAAPRRLASESLREKLLNAASHLLEAAPADLSPRAARRGRRHRPHGDFREVARAVYSDMARLPPEAREELAATRPTIRCSAPPLGDAHRGGRDRSRDVPGAARPLRRRGGLRPRHQPADRRRAGAWRRRAGIGAALYEEIVYDDDGQLHTASLVDYLVPSACEIPAIDVVHLETLSPTTLGGFRGMGEGGTIGAPAAVANAIATRWRRSASNQRASRHARTPVPPDHGTPAERLTDGCWIERQGCAGDRRGSRRRTRDRRIVRARRRERRDQLSGVRERPRCTRRRDHGGRREGEAYQADVADFAAVTAMIAAVSKEFGRLDILINNAGLALRQRFVETRPEDWRRQIDACLYGAIHCCHAAAPHSRRRRTAASSR